MTTGQSMYELCRKMFPFNRSITGDGVRQTLDALKTVYPDITIHEVPSGTPVFDWTVPKEWNIRDAWIKNSTIPICTSWATHCRSTSTFRLMSSSR